MRRSVALVLAMMSAAVAQSPMARPKFDAFEVATVKPVDADAKAGRMFRMDGTHRWVATNFTLKNMIASGYDHESANDFGWAGLDGFAAFQY